MFEVIYEQCHFYIVCPPESSLFFELEMSCTVHVGHNPSKHIQGIFKKCLFMFHNPELAGYDYQYLYIEVCTVAHHGFLNVGH